MNPSMQAKRTPGKRSSAKNLLLCLLLFLASFSGASNLRAQSGTLPLKVPHAFRFPASFTESSSLKPKGGDLPVEAPQASRFLASLPGASSLVAKSEDLPMKALQGNGFLASLAGVSSLVAKSGDLPVEALQACRRGDYKAGREGFEKWLAAHPEGNGLVEYNLGNCEYRLDRPAYALWRWKRASRRLGNRPEITHNIALVQRQLSLPPEDQAGLLRELQSQLQVLRPRDYWHLSLLFLVPALFFLFLYLRRRRPIPLILGLLLYLPALLSAQKAGQSPKPNPIGVVVLQDDLPLRTEPRPSLPPTARLPKGLSLPLLTQTPEWLKVRYGHTQAWLPRKGTALW